MGFSKLISKKVMADPSNYTKGRAGYEICKFTPHHMAGKLTGEQCARLFQNPKRNASANYCIGYDGEIVGCVDENNRAWTSSSKSNDCQAITVEVANSQNEGDWPISQAAWDSLVNLAVDVCQRYNFKLTYDGTPEASLTRHNMFAKTACPGPYLQARFDELVDTVNARLDELNTSEVPDIKEVETNYKIKIFADEFDIYAKPYDDSMVVAQITDGGVYTIVAQYGDDWGKLKSGAGWLKLTNKEAYGYLEELEPQQEEKKKQPVIKKGMKIMFIGTKSYSGLKLADWTHNSIFDVIEVSGDRVVMGKGTAVTAAVNIKDCQPI